MHRAGGDASRKMVTDSGHGRSRRWQSHGKLGAKTGRTVDGDLAAVGFDGAAHDAEAQPGTFDFLAVVFCDAIEPFEDER